MEIKQMSIDLETYSDADLEKCGVYKYTESSQFEILLFGVSINGGEPKVYDLVSGDTVPEEIVQAIADKNIVKWAYNAAFERICLSAGFFAGSFSTQISTDSPDFRSAGRRAR